MLNEEQHPLQPHENAVNQANPLLRVRFLGGFQFLLADETALHFPQRKVLALLAYLALNPQREHSRTALIGLFWPDVAESNARASLRMALSNARKALQPTGLVDEVLDATRTSVGWARHGHVAVDALQFQAHLQQGDLPQALSLYRGPLLDGLYLDDCPAFDDWVSVQRQRYHLQALDAANELASLYTDAGDYAHAEQVTRRQLELDPLHDAAQRRLLRLLAYQGQHNAARSQFQAFKALLRDELGIEPDAELQMLMQQIDTQTLALPTTQGSVRLARVHHLPETPTPFFGRDADLAALSQRLQKPTYRLISLIGPGGIGKTRLALEALRHNQAHYRHGVYFVPLAGVAQPDQLPFSIAAVLDLQLKAGEETIATQLIAHLRHRKLLLLLDNFEHLIADTSLDLLVSLLKSCPGVVLLVTSRQYLNLQVEDTFRLEGLPYPENAGQTDIGRYDAVQLFVDRAQRVNKRFDLSEESAPAVLAICQITGGIPLALELVAAGLRDADVQQLAEAIRADADRLQTTMHDVPTAHRSLRSVFDYSWRLLTQPEQRLLAALAAFRGGFSTAAAVEVCGATPGLLARLEQASLIRKQGAERYDMHELTRQFAAEQLQATAHMGAIHRAYAGYYCELLAQQAEALVGAHPQTAIQVIQHDWDNVWQAWLWGVRANDLEALARALTGLHRYCLARGLYQEVEHLLAEALAVIPATRTLLHLDTLLAYSEHLLWQTKYAQARPYAEAAQKLAQGLGDAARNADAWRLIALLHDQTGDTIVAIQAFEQALAAAQRAENPLLFCEVLRRYGLSLSNLGHHKQALACLHQALQVAQQESYRTQEQSLLLYLGLLYSEMHDLLRAMHYAQAALSLIQATGNRPLEARIQNMTGFGYAQVGQLEQALPYHEQSRQISQEIGDPFQESHALHNLCTVNRKLGRYDLAEHYGQQALRLGLGYHLPDPSAYAWLHLGYLAADRGDFAQAAEYFQLSRDSWAEQGQYALRLESQAGLARALLHLGQGQAAQSALGEVLSALDAGPLDGVDELFEVYLACYDVLRSVGDARADAVLQAAQAHLEHVAASIEDRLLRETYLRGVPVHRRLLQLGAQQRPTNARQHGEI